MATYASSDGAVFSQESETGLRWSLNSACALAMASTLLIPWGTADEKFLWSRDMFNNFYTLHFKIALAVLWCAAFVAAFASLRLGKKVQSIAYLCAAAAALTFISIAKARPVAWSSCIGDKASWSQMITLIVLAAYLFVLGVNQRGGISGSMRAWVKAVSVLLAGAGVFKIVELAGKASSISTVSMIASLLALGMLVLAGVVSFVKFETISTRANGLRLLVVLAVFLPVLGLVLEPLLTGDQVSGIFSHLNIELIVGSAALLMIDGLAELSVLSRIGVTPSLSAICIAGAYFLFPKTAALPAQPAPAVQTNSISSKLTPPILARKGDWTQWCGGPDRNMISDETGLPDKFDAVTDPAEADLNNIKWAVPLAKRTLGSPVVAGGKVYIGGQDFKDNDELAMLWCFDEDTGKLLWRMQSPYIPWLYNLHSFGNCATPTIDGDRLYTCNHLGDVLCLSTAGLAGGNKGPFTDEASYFASNREITKSEISPEGNRTLEITAGTPAKLSPLDADIIWLYDFIQGVNSWPFNALNSAVLIYGDKLFVGTASVKSDPYFKKESSAIKIDEWKTQQGKKEYVSPSLVALDRKTGKLLACDDERIFETTFHGAHSSPALGAVNGRDLVFYGAGNGTCFAFDPNFVPNDKQPAALKCVWKFNCLNARIKRAEIIATPVFYKNRIYVAIGNDLAKSGSAAGPGRLVCIDATQSGDITETGKIWSYDEIRSSATTVAISNGRLYTGDAAGNIYCFDADSGKLYWKHTAKHPVWSSPLAADGKVYFGTHNGGVLIFEDSKEKKIVAQCLGKEDIISSPAVANGTLYYASQRYLYALKLGAHGKVIKPDAVESAAASADAAKVSKP